MTQQLELGRETETFSKEGAKIDTKTLQYSEPPGLYYIAGSTVLDTIYHTATAQDLDVVVPLGVTFPQIDSDKPVQWVETDVANYNAYLFQEPKYNLEAYFLSSQGEVIKPSGFESRPDTLFLLDLEKPITVADIIYGVKRVLRYKLAVGAQTKDCWRKTIKNCFATEWMEQMFFFSASEVAMYIKGNIEEVAAPAEYEQVLQYFIDELGLETFAESNIDFSQHLTAPELDIDYDRLASITGINDWDELEHWLADQEDGSAIVAQCDRHQSEYYADVSMQSSPLANSEFQRRYELHDSLNPLCRIDVLPSLAEIKSYFELWRKEHRIGTQLSDSKYQLAVAEWDLICKLYDVHEVISQELVTAMADYIEKRVGELVRPGHEEIIILEVTAGHGKFSRFISDELKARRVPCVYIAAESNLESSDTDGVVLNMDAQQAIATFQPDIVVDVQIQQLVNLKKHFSENSSVQEYILLGILTEEDMTFLEQFDLIAESIDSVHTVQLCSEDLPGIGQSKSTAHSVTRALASQ